MKEAITIFTAAKARELLKYGYKIIDIKPNKYDKSNKRSVFVFENEKGLEDRLNSN